MKPGETWKVRHSRKGDLTVRIDREDDEWLYGQIIEGEARYVSDAYNMAQRAYGKGTPGDDITMRKSLTTGLEKVA